MKDIYICRFVINVDKSFFYQTMKKLFLLYRSKVNRSKHRTHVWYWSVNYSSMIYILLSIYTHGTQTLLLWMPFQRWMIARRLLCAKVLWQKWMMLRLSKEWVGSEWLVFNQEHYLLSYILCCILSAFSFFISFIINTI